MTKLKVGIISALVLVGVGLPLVVEYHGEPSHGGKTVTQWLESLRLYSWTNVPIGLQMVMRPSEEVAADPALRAISAIGPRAVPVLMQRISEPGELPPTMTRTERWKVMLRWKLLGKPGPSGNWVQQDRKHAAGVALLALGTNAGGGFSKFMEAYAAAPWHTSIAGGRLSGMGVGVSAGTVVQVAYGALPERRAEILAAVMAGLEHTNATYRMLALEAAYQFPEELLQRKKLFLKLTLDEHQYVQAAALADLTPVVYHSRLRPLMSLAEVRQAAEAVLDSPSTPERNKGIARSLIRYVDQQETQPAKSPAP